jgi:hypothetical protein
MTKNEEKIHAKHNKALAKFYASWNVGDTWQQKHSFWHAQYPNTNVYTNDIMQEVKVFEVSWLGDQFPKDFPSF